MKKGEFSSGFKKRYFVAYNKKDHFVIKYFTTATEHLKEKPKSKGFISCAGYSAQKENNAHNTIILHPHDDERREWVLHCETKEIQDEWMSIFHNACWHAKPVPHENSLVQAAFEIAFANLKKDVGIFYFMPFDRPPPEMLTALLVADLKREILPGIFSQVNPPMGIGKQGAVKAVKKSLVAICSASCGASWKAIDPLVIANTTLMNEVVKPKLTPLFEAQNKLVESIASVVSSTAQPLVDTMNSEIFGPVLGKVIDPIVAVCKAAIDGFERCTKEKLDTIADDDSKKTLITNVSYSFSSFSPMIEANKLIHDIENGFLAELAGTVRGLSVWKFTRHLDSSIRNLIRRAIYTAHKLASDGMDGSSALNQASADLLHDLKLLLSNVVYDGLIFMISDKVDEEIIQPCKELVGPIEEQIPEPFKEFISITSLLEQSIETIISDILFSISKGATDVAVSNF